MKPKILVPFDFGAASERALAWAVDLARTSGGGIHVLHLLELIPPVSLVGVAPLAMGPDDVREVEAAVRASIERSGFSEATSSVEFSPSYADAVLEAAKARGCDLIVMGTHGRGALARLALGSVADRVVRHADVPVVTVRAPPSA